MIANIIAAKIYNSFYEKSSLLNKMVKSYRKENNATPPNNTRSYNRKEGEGKFINVSFISHIAWLELYLNVVIINRNSTHLSTNLSFGRKYQTFSVMKVVNI